MMSHQSHIGLPHSTSVTSDDGSWSMEHQHQGMYANDSPPGTQGSHLQSSSGGVSGFNSMQKKVTRDGQPPKRRGPKPDSKPAQTRRQELNRQAQRTHRERKEQYIKALETELARIREAFAREAVHAATTIRQHEIVLRDSQQEILILRDMLTTRGVPYDTEVETRKAGARVRGRDTSSLSPSHISTRPLPFQSPLPPPASSSGYSTIQDQTMYSNDAGMSASGHSPGTTHHSHSPHGPDIQEQIKTESPEGIADMPGIFERDPQLGIEFILALEATCRDHHEYLVRRSVSSPNDPEKALFSGHALMASCPPPSHIDNVPAQMGGLKPTYPHQAPQVSLDALNRLLNLSQKIKDHGFVDGGQVTPIMALQSLRGHRNYNTLNRDDVVCMIDSIRAKVRCYGFGAVMEDFELRDALTNTFATKPETYADMGSAEIDEMYS